MLTFILMPAYPCQDSVTESQPLMFAWCTGGSVNGSETIDGRRTGRGSLRGTSSRTKSLLSRLCNAGAAILNLEYGYRYRRKGANLSDINCFRVKEIEMSEKLSFDWFIAKIHEVFDRLPDYRKFSPNLRYSVKEAVLGAFALFFSQSPSFLAYQQAMQQAQRRSNAQSLFGIEQIPSDNQIRNLLDPIAPGLFYPVFSSTFEHLEKAGYLKRYRFFEGCL